MGAGDQESSWGPVMPLHTHPVEKRAAVNG